MAIQRPNLFPSGTGEFLMRLRCAFCGKLTVPFVMIGTEAVGPKCAKRAGLNRKSMAGTKVQFVKALPQSQLHPRTLPLFADLEEEHA